MALTWWSGFANWSGLMTLNDNPGLQTFVDCKPNRVQSSFTHRKRVERVGDASETNRTFSVIQQIGYSNCRREMYQLAPDARSLSRSGNPPRVAVWEGCRVEAGREDKPGDLFLHRNRHKPLVPGKLGHLFLNRY